MKSAKVMPGKKEPAHPDRAKKARAAQLRRAKRAQRERERKAGLRVMQLKLPAALARRMAFAAKQDGFENNLRVFLEKCAVAVADYPQLRLLCWNRQPEFVTPREAWELYERNWRFIDRAGLAAQERQLIRELASCFGGEIVSA